MGERLHSTIDMSLTEASRFMPHSEIDKSAKRPVIRNVQALRALAALLVVLLHMSLPQNGIDIHSSPIVGVFSVFGRGGVDLFFAISGFIMLVTSWEMFQKPGASVRFILHRIIRIYPPYWLALVPILVVFLVARDRLMTGHDSLNTDILGSFLLYPQPVQKTLLPVAWTLVFEMTFYVIFTLMLLADRKYIVRMLFIWTFVQVSLFFLFGSSTNPYLRYLGNPQPLEFVFGMAIGLCYVHGWMPHRNKVLAAGVAGVLAVWALSLANQGIITGADRVILFGVPFSLVLYGAVALELSGTFASPLWLVVLGDASYAVYLWHFAILNALRQVFLRLHPAGRASEIVIVLSSLLIVQVFGLVVYRFFERPVTVRLNAFASDQLRRWKIPPMTTARPLSVAGGAEDQPA
jgi:peptidoglycan/LPS O-acetylase OafA/YrhL